jgi:hypothetical protein
MPIFANMIADNRVQIFSIIGSLALFFFIITLIKKRRLKEEYAILWLATSVFFFVLSVCKSMLELLAKLAGVHYAPAALLLLLILAITVILIHYSTVITKLSKQNKLLAQELALLRNEIFKREDR